uniref:Uncharacterized protein n=1 Tax=Arundo donax TaxID=35708 RepID=A0A0A9D2M3_ARUDO
MELMVGRKGRQMPAAGLKIVVMAYLSWTGCISITRTVVLVKLLSVKMGMLLSQKVTRET